MTGVDIEPSAIETAKRHYPGPDYLCGSIESIPWSGMFDWCVSFETIEHIPNPQEVLNAFRVDCDGLICSTPNQDRYPFDPAKFDGDTYPHLRHYKPDELTELLESCGWEVLQKFCQVGKRDPVTHGTNGMFLLYICR